MSGANTIAKKAAAAVMADLRERGEFCHLISLQKSNHPAWVQPDVQDAMEERIAQIIDEVTAPLIVEEIAKALCCEVEKRRSAERQGEAAKRLQDFVVDTLNQLMEGDQDFYKRMALRFAEKRNLT